MSSSHALASSSLSSPAPTRGGDGGSRAPPRQPRACRVPGCTTQLDRGFHWKYRVCRMHTQVQSVVLDDAGVPQRFCQQCSKFHTLDAFEGERHSCRESLGRHQERRRRKRSQAEAEAPAGSSKRKSGAEGSQKRDTHSKPSGSRPRSGKQRQGGSTGSTTAQLGKAEREGKPAKHRPRKPRAAPTPPKQQKQPAEQAQRGHEQQQQRRQQQAEQCAPQAALPGSPLTAAQAQPPPSRPLQLPTAAPNPPPQQACGGVSSSGPGLPAVGSATVPFNHHAPWIALRTSVPLTSADACSSQWRMPFDGEQQAAAAAAKQQPRPLEALPAVQPAAAAGLGAASGHSGLSLLGGPSMDAEIEELLRFEGPLFPELGGMDTQSLSSSWLGSSLQSSWPSAAHARSAAAGGLSGLPAEQPMQPGPGFAPLAPQQAQSAAQPAALYPPRPPSSSSLRAEPLVALQAPPAAPWKHHHHHLHYRHHRHVQQQQQQPPPQQQQQHPSLAQHQQPPAGFAVAASFGAAAWGSGSLPTGSYSTGAPVPDVVVRPTAGQAAPAAAAPAVFTAPMPASSPGNAHLAAAGAAATAAAAAAAAPGGSPQPPACSQPGAVVTTGSGVQPWNAAWWQAH